jgi:hypothetical protein
MLIVFASANEFYYFAAGLEPNTLYKYQCGDPSLSAMTSVQFFSSFNMVNNHPELILMVWDVSYAESWLQNLP